MYNHKYVYSFTMLLSPPKEHKVLNNVIIPFNPYNWLSKMVIHWTSLAWPYNNLKVNIYEAGLATDSKCTIKAITVFFKSNIPESKKLFEWFRISSPTTHRGAVRKDGAEIP